MSGLVVSDFLVDILAESFSEVKYQYTVSSADHYVHNQEKMEIQVKKPLDQRIKKLYDDETGIFSYWSVDSAVIVKSVSEAFQKHQLSRWNQIRQKTIRAKSILTGGAVVLVTCIGAGLYSYLRPKAVPVTPQMALVAGVVAVIGTSLFAGIQWLQAFVADMESAYWNNYSSEDPAKEIADRRSVFYEKQVDYRISTIGSIVPYMRPLYEMLHPSEIRQRNSIVTDRGE